MKLFSTFFVLASIVVGGFAAANVTINASIQALISACDATTAIVTSLTPSSNAAAIAVCSLFHLFNTVVIDILWH
jgi:hypothetical protein